MDEVRQLILCDERYTGADVRVAVLDTGVDLSHPDLKDRIDREASQSFSTRDDLIDRHGHGTHIAGIIAGTGRASEGKYRG